MKPDPKLYSNFDSSNRYSSLSRRVPSSSRQLPSSSPGDLVL